MLRIEALAADNPAGSTIYGTLGSPSDTSFTNAGTIYANSGPGIRTGAAHTVINNSGSIFAYSGYVGVNMINGTIDSFNNSGTIQSSGSNALWWSAATTSFTNSGKITSSGTNAVYHAGGTVDTLTNTGEISSTSGGYWHYGILNQGTIVTLNNLQGGTKPLTIAQNLPQNYNVIIRSATNYGTLSNDGGGGGVSGLMKFGVYSGSLITQKTYTTVLSGIDASHLSTLSGSYNGYQWQLVDRGNGLWDLFFANFTTNTETQDAVKATAGILAQIQGLQNAILANGLRDYDCRSFDQQGICIGGGGRATTVRGESSAEPGGLLIAAYRIDRNFRIGAYVDETLGDTNFNGTVRLEGRIPTVGLFGAWNENPDGRGAELKLAVAQSRREATIRRPVIDGTSEPGAGRTPLTSQAVLAIARYAYDLDPEISLSPYAGLRYTRHQVDGYREGQSSSVTLPLTYGRLTNRAFTALAGLDGIWRLAGANLLRASVGLENDLVRRDGDWKATGITGLAPVPLYDNPRRLRATAALGFTHAVDKTQRINLDLAYRQSERPHADTTDLMLTYTAGF